MNTAMFLKALPFAISLLLVPAIAAGAAWGGWWLLVAPLWAWVAMSVLDRIMGLDTSNMDPATQDSVLFWHRAVTWIWVPVQIALIYGCIWAATLPGHLSTFEALALAFGCGIATGGIGITYAHELIHQRNRWEKRLGEVLLCSVTYGHFTTEHVFGHHVTVGTPKDPVSARMGESIYRFFPRAVIGSFVSAWEIERDRLARKGRPVWHRSNPFWRYAAGTAVFVALAAWVGGWAGVGLFFVQSFFAILQLEEVNYVEHYGLTRKYLGGGKFERVAPRHSWNASHRATNYLLINLQRHSDHHYRPDRRFPLLQHYPSREAPQLPFGYPLMIMIALNPPLWMRMMNKRVRKWREKHYPEIEDWTPYETGRHEEPAAAA